MADTLQLYVKMCNNVPYGMPLTTFALLSPVWTGERLSLPFGPEQQVRAVVGWTDLFFGSPCNVNVARVHAPGGPIGQLIDNEAQGDKEGYLVYGGNQGVRIYQHAPEDGYGQPIVWVEDLADLPPDVQAIVGQGTYLIDVRDLRAFVTRRSDRGAFVPASNAEDLEQDAIAAIEAQGGAHNISGQYSCPPELAARGIWQG